MVRSVSIVAPTLSGGGVTRAYFLADLIQSLNLEVEVVGHLGDGQDIYPMPPDNIRVIPIRGARIWHYSNELLDHLSGDLIYAVKPRISSFGLGIIAKWKKSRPLLLDIDDWERSYRIGRVVDQGKLLLMEKLVGLSDAVTVNNSTLKMRFGGTLLPSGKSEKLYDAAKHDPAECRRRLGLDGQFVLMFPGTAVPHSGLEDLLRAMEQVGRDDLVLVVVGGRRAGAEHIDRHLSRWKKFIKRMPEVRTELLPSIISAAHVVTAPHRDTPTSRYNFPIKLIDGIAMGKPILATKVGDIPQMLGGVAYLAEPDSPTDLARLLKSMLDDPDDRLRRGRLGRERFEQHFSFEALGKIMEGVLRKP